MMLRPRVGAVAVAELGYYLGEKKAPGKYTELRQTLAALEFEVIPAEELGTETESLTRTGRKFREQQIDCLCVLLTTFVPELPS